MLRALLVGGGLGICISLSILILFGGAYGFLQGVGSGHENAQAPYTLPAVGLGAGLFLWLGAAPAALFGLAFGTMVVDGRRHRAAIFARPVLPPPPRWRQRWIGLLDLVLGLAPGILCGGILVIEGHRLLETHEWLFLVGQVGWFVLGLLLMLLGLRRLLDRFESFRTVPGLRIGCTFCAAALIIWGHYYGSLSPSDPSGALKATAHMMLIGAALFFLVYLLVSTVYLYQSDARENARLSVAVAENGQQEKAIAPGSQ